MTTQQGSHQVYPPGKSSCCANRFSRSEHVLSYAAKQHRSWGVHGKESSFTGAQNNLGHVEPFGPSGPPSCSKLGQYKSACLGPSPAEVWIFDNEDHHASLGPCSSAQLFFTGQWSHNFHEVVCGTGVQSRSQKFWDHCTLQHKAGKHPCTIVTELLFIQLSRVRTWAI